MEYRCISADCHIDICWLPHDLFVSNASKALKDRMPYVTRGAGGPKWVTRAGVDLGFANGQGSTGTTGNAKKMYVPGADPRQDRLASTNLYSDGSRGVSRPTTPELRLQDQERDGIQAEVIYGLHGTGSRMKDQEATIELYRIYNDWLTEFCNYDRKRFVGLASMPCHSVEAAVTETRRVAKLGLGGLEFLASSDMITLWDPYWDPFWQVAAEVNMPVHFHTIAAITSLSIRAGLPESYKLVNTASLNGGLTIHLSNILGALIFGGVLERYRDLRIVLGESGIGWIPYVLQRMDSQYEGRYKSLDMNMKPSDYWHRQCWATFQNDSVGVKLLDELGVGNIMWASDYPHPDGVFPDSQEYIQRQFSHLPGNAQRRITCENAGKLYNLMS